MPVTSLKRWMKVVNMDAGHGEGVLVHNEAITIGAYEYLKNF
jgi:hypothetical protein